MSSSYPKFKSKSFRLVKIMRKATPEKRFPLKFHNYEGLYYNKETF